MVGRKYLLAPLLLVLILLFPACAELELLTGGSRGGPGPPPSGSLSVSFIDVGQGDGVLVQAGGESYLIDAGRPEEGPNVVDGTADRSRARGQSALQHRQKDGRSAERRPSIGLLRPGSTSPVHRNARKGHSRKLTLSHPRSNPYVMEKRSKSSRRDCSKPPPRHKRNLHKSMAPLSRPSIKYGC
jgi:hypothetical protein